MTTPTQPLRSKAGCWTCRLRRKKCDERQPICLTCESLKITCYGYDPKRPEWMDGGVKEKEVSEAIKKVVKVTSRRKRFGGLSVGMGLRRKGVVSLAPKLSVVEKETGGSPESSTVTSMSGVGNGGSLGDKGDGSSPNSSIENHAQETPHTPAAPAFAFPSEDAILLMHFIDNVFPLQYPVYKPSIAEGGRGWVISLLLKTKPLYHACLALASFHRGAVLLEVRRGPCNSVVVIEQERHLEICLRDFRESIQSVSLYLEGGRKCPKHAVDLGLMACIVQLIYFELFAGHDTWQIHLQAASSAFSQGYFSQLEELGMLRGREAIWDPTEDRVHGCAPNEQKAIFRFMGGVIFWLDTISSITFGTFPNLIEFHAHALSPSSHIKLENIMGCHNWVVLQIGRIASLYAKKGHVEGNGCPNTGEWVSEAEDIRNCLHQGLMESRLGHVNLDGKPAATIFGPSFITKMFGFAAAAYLHVVVNGFEVEDGMLLSLRGEAMLVLREQVPAEMMHTIIFPLYMVGAVAPLEDQPFFRHVFTTMPVLNPSLEHRRKILPTLESVWSGRSSGPALSWEESLKLADQNLLLV